MKKIILSFVAAAALFTACDPTQSEKDFDANSMTADELSNLISFSQYSMKDSVTAQTDGNWIVYTTNPGQIVTIYNYNSDGSENLLAYGKTNGAFLLRPKRGSDPNQTVHLRFVNSDGSVTEAEKSLTVEVAQELTPEMRLLASDAYGYKVWKWDTSWRADGGAWGNMGYAPGDGESFVTGGNGIWWACPPADLTGQLQHSNTGTATGEEDPDAYMEFNDEGMIKTYDKDGNVIRKGTYSVTGWDGTRSHASHDGSQAKWSYGTLKTSEGAILFPFQINGKGFMPTEFEIMQLDASHLKLIYPIKSDGTCGSWGEATWWAFKSESDGEGALTDFGEKSWTWDTEFRSDGGAWGNMGYAPGDGASFVTGGNGIWFACPPDQLTGQLQHSNTGKATGEEDPNAYMTFNWKDGTVKSYDANGKEIRSGKWEIVKDKWGMGKRLPSTDGSQASWKLGTLHTDAGSILFPFQINANGATPTDFEIMQLDVDHLKLIYPYKADGSVGSWNEATWWAFKKK